MCSLMVVLFVLAFAWLSMRTLLLAIQLNRHTPEAILGRAFQHELLNRGLILDPADVERLSRDST